MPTTLEISKQTNSSSSSSSSSSTSTSSSSVSSAVSMSLSSKKYKEIWTHLWLPLLISLSKDHFLTKAQSIELVTSIDSCPAQDPNLYFRPVIGILTHPGDGASGRLNNATNASYIAASYVKFVESAGARVIPIVYNESQSIIAEKLSLVNGVLFTGGWAKTGLYFETATWIFEQILEKNDKGDHFPLFAICLGFEVLNMIISKNNDILERFSARDQASTLQFVENTKIDGTVFQRFPPELLRKLSTDCLVMQNHQYGISPKRFQETSTLSNFFRVLTTSTDDEDQDYISTVQAQNYPITAFQWHPEKNAFEWGISTIPHSEDAIHVTQHVANYFIREARKSLNRPPTRKVLDNLIYNYSPTYCGKAG
ncbi:hypothetical protein AQUCO_03900032v1 [Aquilegia coerulea]|nr:hypothetical protein AQUCO_03900032v1 [Aquilegia coerulea]